MPDLPTFGDASDAASAAKAHGRTLIPWLPDPERCPACEALMYADETWHPRVAAPVTSWYCEACDQHYERDPEYGEMIRDGPTPGATHLQELMHE